MEQTPQGFASEDEEATYCLSLLRDGDRHQKIVARERLSQIFERRGMLDEAAQCLESNIREGVRDPRVYQRLAGVYRRQGRHELADEVLVEARRLAERMTRPPQPGARRPVPGRPAGRPPQQPQPPVPSPNPLQAPTAQMPAAAPPPGRAPAAPPPPPGGELELDPIGAGPRPGSGLIPPEEQAPTGPTPWWLSPPMVVLLILLCGPYGLALMWVNAGYAKQTKVRVTGIWAGLIVLLLAGSAVTAPSQITSLITGSAGVSGLPIGGAPATPIVFPSAPSSTAKPALPPGLSAAPSPPAIAASPGVTAGGPPGTIINPGPPAEPKPAATSAPAAAQNPDPEGGPRFKVGDTGGTGANLRDKPGQTGTVVKTIPEGSVVEVVGEDRQMDGKTWKNIKDDSGTAGWMAAELLEPA